MVMPRPRIHNRNELKEVRRHLRHTQTPAEAALWKALKASKLSGKKFRRQRSIGNYIVDFYCPECGLAVELDGGTHFDPARSDYDLRRQQFLKKLNIRVARFENSLVFENPEAVLEVVKGYLTTP